MRPFLALPLLDAATCRRVRAAMDCGASEPADVLRQASVARQLRVRRATSVDVDSGILALVEQHLDWQRTAIAAFYGLTLSEREGASFLRYRAGGFYRPHRDHGVVASWPAASRRRIAAIVFLNSSRQSEAAGEFSGGAVRLLPERAAPIEIHPLEGMLVAFPATMLHEVCEVHDGTRDTVVDWFY